MHCFGLVAKAEAVEEVQRNQLKVVSDDDSFQLTRLTVREFCSEADPDMTGLDRATGALRTCGLEAVTRIVDPRVFLAVTRTTKYLPASAEVSTLLLRVAPLIEAQPMATELEAEGTELLQLNH